MNYPHIAFILHESYLFTIFDFLVGPVILDLGGDAPNGDNNGNNENGDNGDDGSGSDSWSSVSDDSDDSYGNDSSGLSAMEDLLFEY